jgi:hypothetical protein
MSDSILKYVTETMVRLERSRLEANDAANVIADRLTMRAELLLNLLHEYRGEQDEDQLVEAVSVAAEIEALVPELRRTLVSLVDADGRCRTMPAVRAELLRLRELEDDDGC